MLTLDSQVHVYGPDTPEHPHVSKGLHGPAAVTGEDMIAAMDEAGVDGALLVSALMIYGHDASYALGAFAAFPDRFRVIKPIDPANPAVGDVIAEWAQTAGAVGVRIVLRSDIPGNPDVAALDRAIGAAACHAMPVNIMCWERLDLMADLASRHPDAMLIVDHLGMKQPIFPPVPANPFADLPNLLNLARSEPRPVRKRRGQADRGRHAVAPGLSVRRSVETAGADLRRVRP